jgi:hypothetical protein
MTRPLLVLSLALCLPAEVKSQPLSITVETLDWMAADSQVIVRAVVTDFVHEVDDSKTEWDTVVIKVRETLKGQHRPFHTFVIQNYRSSDHTELSRYKKSGQELLVFLVESKRFGKKVALYGLTPRRASHRGLIELAVDAKTPMGGDRFVYTLDLKNLRQPKEILDYTRTAITAGEKIKKLRSHSFQSTETPGWVTRVVPVDERLARQARRWVASNDPKWRLEGAKALQYFKSDENVAALKKLLKDPDYRLTDLGQDGQVTKRHRLYEVRQAAFASLKEMGIQVPEPVVREPPGKRE